MEQIGFGQWLRGNARQPDYVIKDRETRRLADSKTQTQLRFGHATFWL